MYFWSFREEGGFHEKLTNEILGKLVEATEPRFMRITANWNVRGGIFTTVVAEHKADGWSAPAQGPAGWRKPCVTSQRLLRRWAAKMRGQKKTPAGCAGGFEFRVWPDGSGQRFCAGTRLGDRLLDL